MGVDLVMHSTTKYIGGHGDAVGGAVAGRSDLIRQLRIEAGIHHGGILSPFNAWLIARGAATLPLRMKAHAAGAQAVASAIGGRSVQADITNADSMSAAVVATEAAFGGLSTLVANAGIGQRPMRATETPIDEMQRQFTVNALGVAISCQAAVPAAAALLFRARALDLFQLGERAAYHSGLDVEREKLMIGLLSALGVGAATAAAGPIGFIGLVAPHIARMIVGPDHRFILPAAALIGASLALGADLLVRTAAPPAEPPIGLATALIGGPFFLWLVASGRRRRI